MSTSLRDEPIQKNAMPTLTPAAIERVRQGVAAASDRVVRQSIHEALSNVEAIAQSRSDRRASGWLRRKVMRSLIHTLFRVRVEYPERIPDRAAILAPNHLSHIDPLLLLSEVPAHPYYYIPGDARTLYNHWWKRQILKFAGGVIPLERRWREEIAVVEAAKAGRRDLATLAAAIERDVPTGADFQTLRAIERAIQAIFARGDGLLIFPEGRLGKVEGQLQLPLARGVILYALRAGVPIVPVAIVGTQDLYFRKELTIRFGEPLHFPQSKRPKPQDVKTALDALQDALIALLPQDYQEPNEPKLLRYFLNHLLW
ncbi:MAG TPA: 1-acyl-sn-glycerol-3-phosphate acyltransferase [Allocoleopsis sp.]